ncbi:hypothetical protein FOL46_009709 [Perkinsus olseni]|uniref:HIT domain-containing protein n=1 Tax=Perkinsus olseni TaxID=32597 RepID=A0A7J6ML69_PEROL|nr:hypothetical protein FOL46_009709 [Perkinsus olseni]
MGCGASSSSKPEEVVKTVPVEEPKPVEEEAPAAAGNGDAGPESMRASVSNYVQGLASAATDKPADGEAAQAPVINVDGVPAVAAYDANEWGKNEKDAPEESKPGENAQPAVEDEEGPVDPAPSAAEETPTEAAAAAVPENEKESGNEEVAEAEGKKEEPAAEESAAAAAPTEEAPVEAAAAAAPTEEAPVEAAVEEGGEVVELYGGGEGDWEEDGELSTKEGCRSDDFFVWRDLEIEIAPLGEEEEEEEEEGRGVQVYSSPVPKSLTTKAWLGAAFLSACTVKLAAPMTAMKFAGGAVAAAPMALVQSSFIPSISPSLSTLYMNLPSVGMALTWVAASFTVPNIIMAATAYVMVKASFGFIRRGRSVPVGSGRPVYYIAAAVTATTACGYLAQLLALSPVFTGITLLGHHVVSLVPAKYIEWIVSSSLMLISAGLMSGAGVKAVAPALVANTIWIGGEFGSLFVITPWWAKTGLYSASLCLGVVPLIWYVGCRLRDISKSHGDRELAGRFRLIADLTVVTWSLYPVAWLLSDGLGIVKIGSTSYAIMISGLDLLSKYGGSTLVTKDHQVLDRAYGIATGHAGSKVRRARVTPVAGEGEPAVYTEPPPLLGELATTALQGEDDAESQSSGNGDDSTMPSSRALLSALTVDKLPFGQYSVSKRELFGLTEHSYALVNLKPVVPGHVLVCSRRPVARLHELSPVELSDLWQLATKVDRCLLRAFPEMDSSTYAVQDGPSAGQTVHHVHIHVMPRGPKDAFNSQGKNDKVYDAIQDNERECVRMDIPSDEEREPRTEDDMFREAEALLKFMDEIDEEDTDLVDRKQK